MNYVVEKFDVLLLMISVEKKNKGKYVISIQIKVFLFNIVLLNVKWNPTKIFWSRKNLIKVMDPLQKKWNIINLVIITKRNLIEIFLDVYFGLICIEKIY